MSLHDESQFNSQRSYNWSMLGWESFELTVNKAG